MQLKPSILNAALASAMLMTAATTQARQQDWPDEEQSASRLDAVVVTGIRHGIEDAIDTKQTETTIVEAISAEDIGKLPDTSIADSIARLPGLTTQRFGGRPQEINIRGFAGDFSTALLNGREQVSLGNNRGVEFDQYPSELLSQVVVHKTTNAQLVGQGLSGTVNLKSARPLSFSERVVALNLRGDMNEIEGGERRYGNRFSLSYIDQFADGALGLALGYARLDNPGQAYQFESWGYPNQWWDGNEDQPAVPDHPGAHVLGGGKLYAIDNDNTRDGLMATLEWRPNEDYSSVLDVFHSRFDKDEFKRGMEFGTIWGAAGRPLPGSTVVDDTVTRARFADFAPIMRNDYNAAHDVLTSVGWNHSMRLGANWTLDADISHSRAKRNERILETYAGLANGLTDTIDISLNPDGYYDFIFGLDYANPDHFVLTDAGGWGQDGYVKDFIVRDSLTAMRMDLEHSFDAGVFSSLQIGANLTSRIKSRGSEEHFLCVQDCRDDASTPIPTHLLGRSVFGFAGLPAILGYDARQAMNLYNLRSNHHGDIDSKNWKVKEDVITTFVQLNIDTDLGSVPLRGNVGVQAVHANQESTGVATFEGVALGETATRGSNYTHYLPSMNLSFGLPWDQFVRVAANRQVARPRMDELRANASYGVNRTDPSRCPGGALPCWSGGGGNPELKPWLADAYDVSWEKYFDGNRGYVSAAYFHKKLRNYIYNQVSEFDFSQLPLPDSVAGVLPSNPIGTYDQPMNGEGGTIKGWELAVSVPFDLFWEPLQGFGFQGNYSDTRSTIHPEGPDSPEPLPGLSKYITNLTLYYERAGFSARASSRKRSPFVGEMQGWGGDRTKIYFSGETVYDLQLGYAFQGGSLQGVSLLLQMNNVTNQPFRSSYDNREDRPRQFWEYGRTILAGVNYRF